MAVWCKLTDDDGALGKLIDGSLVGLGIPLVALGVSRKATVSNTITFASATAQSKSMRDRISGHPRSVHSVHVPDVLLQMFPDLGELASRGTDHVELADDPSSSQVEADETDDSDLSPRVEHGY